MSHKLRILHVSDLHERGSKEPRKWRRRDVLGDAWERNLEDLLGEYSEFDLLCFTGDIAHSGQRAEYAACTEFIEALLSKVKIKRERLFVVPGNHDIDRNVSIKHWTRLRTTLLQLRDRSREVSEWIAGLDPPQDLAKDLEKVLLRQEEYRRWLRQGIIRPELSPSDSPHGRLGYHAALRIPRFPFDVHMVGLDSSWLCGGEDDSGKIWVTADQVMRLAADGNGKALSGFRIAMIHHPLSDLADRTEAQRHVGDQIDLLLRGHLHEPAVLTFKDPDRTSRELVAGCLYEGHAGNKYPNACHVVEVTLDDAGRPLSYDLHFRLWSQNGFWCDDSSLYREARHGRLRDWVAFPSVDPPAQEGVFVGRDVELAELRRALLGDRTGPVAVAVVEGMPGVGKSHLISHFARVHASEFPGGCIRLALERSEVRTGEGLLVDLSHRLEVRGEPNLGEAVRQRLLRPRALLHVENVDSRPAAIAAAELLSELHGCAAVTTGRYLGLGQSVGWSRVEVRPLDETTALCQLQEEFRSPRNDREREQFMKLARELGYLPLALHLASGYLATGSSIDGFLSRLKAKGLDIGPADPADPLLADGGRAILRSTFEISLEHLRVGLGTDAGRLLKGLSCLGHAPAAGFGRGLGAAFTDLSTDDFEELLTQSTRLSILQRAPHEDDAWTMHPLLAELVSSECHGELVRQRGTAWCLASINLWGVSRGRKSGRFDELKPTEEFWVSFLQSQPKNIHAPLPFEKPNPSPDPNYEPWAALCELAAEVPSDPHERIDALGTLMIFCRQAGDLERALRIARRMHSNNVAAHYPKESPAIASVAAKVLADRGDIDEALRIRREEELPIYERLGEVRHQAIACGLVAGLLESRGDWDAALSIREEALALSEQYGNPEDTLLARACLGNSLVVRGAPGDREVAARLLRLALDTADQLNLPVADSIRKVMRDAEIGDAEE